jgi:hypothetical protein
MSNVAKRVLVQAPAFNLAMILRSFTKAGTPRGLAEKNLAIVAFVIALSRRHGDGPPAIPGRVKVQCAGCAARIKLV